MYNEEPLKVDGFMITMCILFPLIAWMLYAFNVSTSPRAARKCMYFSFINLAIIVISAVSLLVMMEM